MGVYAQAVVNGKIALQVDGQAVFSRSGIAVVPETSATSLNHVSVNNVALTATSVALATVQQTGGGAIVKAAVPNVAGSSFTIYLNKAVSVSSRWAGS
jgi:hypothetical protein